MIIASHTHTHHKFTQHTSHTRAHTSLTHTTQIHTTHTTHAHTEHSHTHAPTLLHTHTRSDSLTHTLTHTRFDSLTHLLIHKHAQLANPDGMILLNNVTKIEPHSARDAMYAFEVHFRNAKTSPSSPWILNANSVVSTLLE